MTRRRFSRTINGQVLLIPDDQKGSPSPNRRFASDRATDRAEFSGCERRELLRHWIKARPGRVSLSDSKISSWDERESVGGHGRAATAEVGPDLSLGCRTQDEMHEGEPRSVSKRNWSAATPEIPRCFTTGSKNTFHYRAIQPHLWFAGIRRKFAQEDLSTQP